MAFKFAYGNVCLNQRKASTSTGKKLYLGHREGVLEGVAERAGCGTWHRTCVCLRAIPMHLLQDVGPKGVPFLY